MIEAGRASSIASAGLSSLVSVKNGRFEVMMKLIAAERSGAEAILGEQPKSRVDAFSSILIFNLFEECLPRRLIPLKSRI
jgi:hypothetical protein